MGDGLLVWLLEHGLIAGIAVLSVGWFTIWYVHKNFTTKEHIKILSQHNKDMMAVWKQELEKNVNVTKELFEKDLKQIVTELSGIKDEIRSLKKS